MVRCLMTTNRGRSCSLPQTLPEPQPQWIDENVYQSIDENIHMSAAPGTTITGFYGAQDLEYGMGFEVMGIVTEKCDLVGLE